MPTVELDHKQLFDALVVVAIDLDDHDLLADAFVGLEFDPDGANGLSTFMSALLVRVWSMPKSEGTQGLALSKAIDTLQGALFK